MKITNTTKTTNTKKTATPSRRPAMFEPALQFDGEAPLAAHGLGGLVRDQFGNGRIFAEVGFHGGLLNISYWGNQHLSGKHFFHGAMETGWHKLFRVYVGVGEKRYYPTLND